MLTLQKEPVYIYCPLNSRVEILPRSCKKQANIPYICFADSNLLIQLFFFSLFCDMYIMLASKGHFSLHPTHYKVAKTQIFDPHRSLCILHWSLNVHFYKKVSQQKCEQSSGRVWCILGACISIDIQYPGGRHILLKSDRCPVILTRLLGLAETALQLTEQINTTTISNYVRI